jgi:hypothetical protein
MAAPAAVFTIARVAKMPGEDEDWLADVALGMDPEDGQLTVFGLDDEGTTPFTAFGIENLKELIQIHKASPNLLERFESQNSAAQPAVGRRPRCSAKGYPLPEPLALLRGLPARPWPRPKEWRGAASPA